MPPAPFEIPLACLLPREIQGIVVTGRSISATREANGGARHMGTAMCLGHAAGVYAALAARCDAGRVPDAQEVRTVLRTQNALVSVEDALRTGATDLQAAAISG
jgi:hypothetical protein